MPLTRESFGPAAVEDSVFGMRATPAERAGYILEMVGEMERMAVGSDLLRLRTLLRAARDEAEAQASIRT